MAPTITITRDELSAAAPHGAGSGDPRTTGGDSRTTTPMGRRRWNRTAWVAFIIALLGIPLFGLVSGTVAIVVGCAGMIFGLLAIVVGCIALVGHRHGRRGMALGVIAILLGLFDIVGWSISLSLSLNPSRSAIAMNDLAIDAESLNDLPERIARAMRANVVIEKVAGLGSRATGSGVIMRIRDGMAHIVTNRHTVDLSYTGAVRPTPKDLDALGEIQVITVGQMTVKAKVEWIAPYGVDLAIISAPVLADEMQEAHWDSGTTPHIGDPVFAIGNPYGLNWSHTAGDISQIRRQQHGDYKFRLLQTTAAINPGNSGGGLYDAEGRLIGINTMTGDKRFAEGLGFSISLPTLLELAPERLDLPSKNPESGAGD
jgi:S1-C subfamily serine protease